MKRFIVSLAVLLILCGCAWAAETFPLKDIEVEYDFDSGISKVQGEITNNSGKSYYFAFFKMNFYDESGKLLGTADIEIHSFKEGETVTFEGLTDRNLSKWKKYKIRLNSSF